MTVKTCTKCKEEKDLECFHVDKRLKSGLCSQCKECRKEYRKINKEARVEYDKEYNKEYHQKNKEAKKEYYQKNKVAYTKRNREWAKNNKDRVNSKTARRRALKKSLTVEKVDYNLIRERDHACYLCQVPFTKEEQFNTSLTHVDHKIPLSRTELNPAHSYENVALTHKTCNLEKQAMTPEEYWNKI